MAKRGPQPLGHFGVRKERSYYLELQDVEGSCDHMIEASGQAVPLVHHILSCQAVASFSTTGLTYYMDETLMFMGQALEMLGIQFPLCLSLLYDTWLNSLISSWHMLTARYVYILH